jgi:ankyrin repeat protein
MATLSDFLLIGAIRKNDISHVASLIRDGSADVNCCVGVRDVPLLCLAAKLGHVEIVALLLEAGARIDDVDYFHESACHAAVHGGHIGVVELLIAHHADISLRNEYNGTPISISIIKKNERLLMLLIDAALAAA